MRISIHQPNFFPWLGFFHKIVNSDVFVIFDHVQFPQKGSTWGNRVRFLIGGEDKWFTVPILRSGKNVQNYNEIMFEGRQNWRKKMVHMLQANYSKSPFAEEVFEAILPIIYFESENLAEYNLNAILGILKLLDNPQKKIVKSSSIEVNGKGTDLLVNIVKNLNGDIYLAGGGASGYQVDKLFEQNGIDLLYQNFQHPKYAQHKTKSFVPGLSILDTLFNAGFVKTKNFIQGEINSEYST